MAIAPAGEAGTGVAARITRILAFGMTVKLELQGLNGASGRYFEVESTPEHVSALALSEGQAVRLVPKQLRVFELGSRADPGTDSGTGNVIGAEREAQQR
jgi:sulfate transport system ATP-binding protein